MSSNKKLNKQNSDKCQSCQFDNIDRFKLMCQNQKKEYFIQCITRKIKRNGKSNF
jgi:hypothetical protein